MANEEVLGPRKTMFVLVIVVGCFAVLWPRILAPLLLGPARDGLKPNQFDRDAGCCEVIFETEVAVLEILKEVCSSAVQADGTMSPYAAAECRKAVNETCGVDIAAFLKRSENVGKTTKRLLDTMKASNSSCLKEHFGVPVWSLHTHQAFNSWQKDDTLKQERPARGSTPHPALRERGRAIPAGVPAPRPAPLPPHVRVRSPLSVYFELDIKPPPIPGMRPPLGSPGGPVVAPKSSMGFVMPIYTICIIVFFVYTLSKILFKRTGTTTYESVAPDPQFRRRVFRDDSRSSPDKLVVTAISGLVAEVQQQMEASYAQNQQRQDVQDNHARPYTNGTILHSGPVQIVASEYLEPSKERSPEKPKESTPEPEPIIAEPEKETLEDKVNKTTVEKEIESDKIEDDKDVGKDTAEEETVITKEEFKEKEIEKESEPEKVTEEEKESSPAEKESLSSEKESEPENIESTPEKTDTLEKVDPKQKEATPEEEEEEVEEEEVEEEEEEEEEEIKPKANGDLINLTENIGAEKETVGNSSDSLLVEERKSALVTAEEKEEESEKDDQEKETASVKHEAADVKSIFLETEIPQQSRVLVTDFAQDRAGKPAAKKHSPLVVSGKMTLSLIQDAPRDTPERDPESTVDDFTTASALTEPAEEKEELSDEEVDEEIEVEEIEEEVEEEEEEEEEEKPGPKGKK